MFFCYGLSSEVGSKDTSTKIEGRTCGNDKVRCVLGI